jgi:hypothetical protein
MRKWLFTWEILNGWNLKNYPTPSIFLYLYENLTYSNNKKGPLTVFIQGIQKCEKEVAQNFLWVRLKALRPTARVPSFFRCSHVNADLSA